MVACAECFESDRFLFQCPRCRMHYCEDHRAPESHSCDEAPVQPPVSEDESAVDEPGQQQPGATASPNQQQAPAETSSPQATPASPSPAAAASTGGDEVSPGSSTPAWSLPDWSLPEDLPPSRTVLVGTLTIFVVLAAVSGIAVLGPSLVGQGLPGSGGDAGSGDGGAGSSDGPVDETEVEVQLADNLNTFRTDRGHEPFDYDADLAAIAGAHSAEMAELNYTGHINAEGETVSDRFERFGYDCESPSELVLYTEFDRDIEVPDGVLRFDDEASLANGILELWLQSGPHRNALVSAQWEAVGAGVVVTADDRVFVTLNAC